MDKKITIDDIFDDAQALLKKINTILDDKKGTSTTQTESGILFNLQTTLRIVVRDLEESV